MDGRGNLRFAILDFRFIRLECTINKRAHFTYKILI